MALAEALSFSDTLSEAYALTADYLSGFIGVTGATIIPPFLVRNINFKDTRRKFSGYSNMPYNPRKRKRWYGSLSNYLSRRAKRKRTYYANRRGAGKHTQTSKVHSSGIHERSSRRPYKYHDMVIHRTVNPNSANSTLVAAEDIDFASLGGAVQGGFGISFSLSNMGSYTDFTAMFQYYKILRVQVHFVPLQNTYPSLAVTANGTAAQSATAYAPVSECPLLAVAADDTTNAAFANLSDAYGHSKTVTHHFNEGKTLTISLSPHAKDLVGTAAGPIESHTNKKQWISTAGSGPDLKHYGIRAYAQNFYSGNRVKIYYIMTVAFKDLKA